MSEGFDNSKQRQAKARQGSKHPHADVSKGKEVISYEEPKHRRKATTDKGKPKMWERPARGRLKLNVDGSYGEQTGDAGIGMILRGCDGQVIFSACRTLNHCSSALEAELVACDEGLQLALNWSAEPIELETDCANAVKMLKERQGDSSVWVHLIRRIKQSLGEREVTISKIDRVQNEASHCLANRGRLSRYTQFWLQDYPSELHDTICKDCNSSMT
jgi:ribonuclease HI